VNGPLDLALRLAGILDDLGLRYALGGSLASSVFGEPRATMDIDVAVRVDRAEFDNFTEAFERLDFYVPHEFARAAVTRSSSFNMLDASGFKVDIFVLGDGLLDELQMKRRVRVLVSQEPEMHLWVTSPGDQILRKLDWYRQGGGASDRQWRDVVGLLVVQHDHLDLEDLLSTAARVGLQELLEQAVADAGRI
jgi:hypothetical protein